MSSITNVFTCHHFGCPYYEKPLTCLYSLDRHLKRIHREASFLCLVKGCNMNASSRSKLRTHIRKCHQTATNRNKKRQQNIPNKPQSKDPASIGSTPSATETSDTTLRSFEDIPNTTHNTDLNNENSNPNMNQDKAQGPASATWFWESTPTYSYSSPQTFSMSEHAQHPSYITYFHSSMPTYPYSFPQTCSVLDYAPQSYGTSMSFMSEQPVEAGDSMCLIDDMQEECKGPEIDGSRKDRLFLQGEWAETYKGWTLS